MRAAESGPSDTLAELFVRVGRRPQERCLLHKAGGEWRPVSAGELRRRVAVLAAALRRLGVRRGDRVALMAESGPHWPTVDFATLCSGAVLVPIYPTLNGEDAAYILRDSGARVLFVQGADRRSMLLEQRQQTPDLEHVMTIDDPGAEAAELESLERLLESDDELDLEAVGLAVAPDDLATLIYTSGTTGEPKGVMLTHRNLASNIRAVLEVLEVDDLEVALSFLPLSHSFERTVDYVYFHLGCTIAYAESVHTVPQALAEVRPQAFVSVPRVYEKFLGRVEESLSEASALRRRLFEWGVGVGREALPDRLAGRASRGWLGLRLAVADRLVLGRIRERLGGRFRYAVSGGAPLEREIAEFFWAAGVPIYEGYGLTETSPVISTNAPGAVKLGTVGRPVPGVEVRIAEDGEVLARGPNIMRGYFDDAEATAAAIDDEGWFHTGDIGELDEEGYLSITDRKKELIVNAYGKNIAPAPIENRLKRNRFVEQAVVLGDRQRYLGALLVPDFAALEAWTGRCGIAGEGAELLATEEVQALFDRQVERVNRDLSHHQQIRAWELLPRVLSEEGGELTPTLKVKRRVVEERYAAQIERLFAQPGDGGDGS